MSTYTIYRVTNLINNKVYIGFDSNWPKRISEHKTASKYQKFKIYNAIRKYGWDNFVWDPIYQSWDYEHCLNVMEQHFIDEYDSIRNGYNSTKGGAAGAIGASWWNNGTQQIFTQLPPDNTFVKGRLPFNNVGAKIGAETQKGKIWINNGRYEMMVHKDNIKAGYLKGRLKVTAFNGYNRSLIKGVKWWNNGIDQRMTKTCPGPGWSLGRCRGGGYGNR